MRALSARLRRLEQARHAADHARPTPEEMRQAALTGQGRPVVLAMLDKLRSYAREIEDNTHGYCAFPGPANAHKL